MSRPSDPISRTHRVDKPGTDVTRVDDLPAHEFVDLAYQVVLGHKADPHGLEQHAGQLTSGQKTRNHFVYELTQTTDFKANKPDIEELDDEAFASLTYQVILGRRGTSAEIAHNAEKLRTGKTSRSHLIYVLYQSREFVTNTWSHIDFWLTLHRARLLVAAQLPKAERIVDLGGRGEGIPQGTLLTSGYPYSFQGLSIVDPPRVPGHEPFAATGVEPGGVIDTPQGPVNYVGSSMPDLSALGDGTTDMVYAGQSINLMSREAAAAALREVDRVLRPGGFFCLDTTNRDVTRLQSPVPPVDPHKHEFTHAEMTVLLNGHGFSVTEAKGLMLMDRSVREGWFIEKEVLGRDRFYDDIENCFLLYYRAQKR